MTEYALRLANGADTAPRVRVGDALALVPGSDTDALAARTGLRPGGGVVTVNAGTMGVTVSAFSGWIDGTSTVAQAGYPVALDAAKTLTLADGHATLARVDTIAVQVRETAYDGSGSTDCRVLVIAGTPGAGAPTLPASCLPLRDVNVPAGLSAGTGGLATGNLGADRRTYTSALGGILPVASVTERNALGGKYPGLAVYRTDTHNVEVYNGTGWDPHYASDTGWQTTLWVFASTGFNLGSSPRVRKIGNRVQVELELVSSTYTNAGTGNIADVQVAGIGSPYRPTADVHAWYSTTKAGGAAKIDATGAVTIRTLYAPGIDPGDSLWLSCSYLTD